MQAVIELLFNSKAAEKGIQGFASKFGQTINAVKDSATAVLGGFGATIFSGFSAKEAYDEIIKLADASDLLNLDVERVSRFSNQIRALGGSSEDAVGMLKSLDQAIVDVRTSTSGPLKTLAASVGINLAGVRDSIDMMEKLRKTYKNLNSSGQKKMLQEMGSFDPSVIRMMQMTEEEYRKMQSEATKYGVITNKDKDTALEMQKAITRISLAFQQFGQNVLPMIVPLIEGIARVLEWIVDLGPNVSQTIFIVGAAFASLAPAIGVFNSIAKGIGLVKTAFSALSAFAVANPLLASLMAISAVVMVIANNWETIKTSAMEAWEAIKSFGSKIKNFFSDEEEKKVVPEPETLKDVKTLSATDMNSLPQNNRDASKTTNIDNSGSGASTIITMNFYGQADPRQMEDGLNRVLRQNAGGVRA